MKIVLTAFFLYIFFICTAQNNLPEELHFYSLNAENGLPENSAFEILKDKQGYVWVGTQNGLVRYDGYGTKQYALSNNKEIAFINLLYEDQKKRFWVGTDSGLYQYNYATDKFIFLDINAAEPNADMLIYRIQIDGADNIWMRFFDRRLNAESLGCYNIITKQFCAYSKKQKGRYYINCNNINDFTITACNTVYVATDNGLLQHDSHDAPFTLHKPAAGNPFIRKLYWNNAEPNNIWLTIGDFTNNTQQGIGCFNTVNKSILTFSHNENDSTSLPSNNGYAVYTDSKKQLWITTDKGLCVFHPLKKNFTNHIFSTTSSNDNLINKIYENRHGDFWCAANEGLLFFNRQTNAFKKYTHDKNNKDGLLDNTMHCFLVDEKDNVWAGGWLWGLQWINKSKSKFVTYKNSPSIKNYFAGGKALSFAENDNGDVFIGSINGLYKWQPQSIAFARINFTGSNTDNVHVGFVLKSRNNLLWFTAYNKEKDIEGLYCYNIKTGEVKNFRHDSNNRNSLPGNDITYLYEDKDGILWIGVEQLGLCNYNLQTKTFTHFPYGDYFFKPGFASDSLDQDQVRCITEDKNGNVWVGTNLGGINKYSAASIKFFSYKNMLPGLFSVYSCYSDNRNRLWVGTYDASLFCLDLEAGILHKYSKGLLSTTIRSIIEDDSHNLWLSSMRGFTIFNTETLAVKTITKANGLPKTPDNILYRLKDGRMVYSCEDGFVLFNPKELKTDSITPTVHIESIIYNKPQSKNKSVDSTIICYENNTIELDYDENKITFNCIGLLYQNAEQVKYKYKLDGYDNNWVNANTQRTVTYTNLAPGTYTFHVSAANSDGVWSNASDKITIVITPPFWQTWWFKTLIISSLALTIYAIIKNYLNKKLQAQQREFDKQKAIEEVRSKISMDIHDEISSGLTKISLLSQRIKTRFENNKEVEPEIIEKIAGFSKEVINNLSEIIWAVNPKHDNLQSLLAYIRNYIFHFFESTPVDLNIHFPEEIEAITVSPDVKHNLFLVMKEALHNILKHADATVVYVRFMYNNQSYQFIIKDNGKGMADLNGRTFGNGLTNMQNRMNVINGTISFKNEHGTLLIVEGKFI